MILIADSGSTKTDWALCNTKEHTIKNYNTIGFNPYFIDTDAIYDALNENLLNKVDVTNINKIYFYGAGCSTDNKKNIVYNALKKAFNTATIEVNHDLLGSAKALLGNTSGFAAILGTGSNTCIYDGKNCIANIDSLGYLLGDEGSGSYIGKKLVRDYMRKLMPSNLLEEFRNEFSLTSNEQILHTLYNKPSPNRYLASFCRFTTLHKNNSYISDIVSESFQDFFRNIVSKYPNYQNYTFNSVGSVAFAFKNILEEIAMTNGMQVNRIIKSPIQQLAEYHLAEAK